MGHRTHGCRAAGTGGRAAIGCRNCCFCRTRAPSPPDDKRDGRRNVDVRLSTQKQQYRTPCAYGAWARVA
eukprot:4713397-Prymnesium_polylepis.1